METRRSDVETRVTENLDLVGHVVRSVATRYPRHVDRDDLWNAGALGLVEAANRYDPDSEIPFARYASIRIRGAIIDSTRNRDWATRSVRRDLREIRHAERNLAQSGAVSEQSLAASLGITQQELARRRSHETASSLLHLDQTMGEEGTLGETVRDASIDASPDELIEHKELIGTLRHAVTGLEDRQKEIITRFYLDGDLMRDIADDLGITEARVSQIRSEALAAMKSYFSTMYEEVTPVPDSTPGKRARSAYVESVVGQADWRTRIGA